MSKKATKKTTKVSIDRVCKTCAFHDPANEIDRAVQRIRDIYQHNFMQDQTQVMTAHSTRAFDAESYDNHEEDARRWCKLLLHHMETTWQDDVKEAEILAFYENLPRVGIFVDKDFRHFTTMKKTRAKHLSKVGCWTLTVCAAAVAVLAVIKGQYALAVWPILAAFFDWLATTFQELAEDAVNYGDAMMMANLEQSRELCDAQLKILELENEIERLKEEKL